MQLQGFSHRYQPSKYILINGWISALLSSADVYMNRCSPVDVVFDKEHITHNTHNTYNIGNDTQYNTTAHTIQYNYDTIPLIVIFILYIKPWPKY